MGAREIGFTVVSMSTSLIAVFIPILLMGGIVGRLFHEFAVTLSAAIAVSLVVSLTTTPMLCARFLKPHDVSRHGRMYRLSERGFYHLTHGYKVSLGWVLRHRRLILALAIVMVFVNVFLYIIVPKGFFPQQDTGRLSGMVMGDQDVSFDAMKAKTDALMKIVQKQEDWNLFDFPRVEKFSIKFKEAQQLFSEALGKLHLPAEASVLADQTLSLAMDLSEELGQFHADLLIQRRQRHHPYVEPLR